MKLKDPFILEPESKEPFFRAINVEGHRRGIRLEKLYWAILEELCKEHGLRMSDVISGLENADNVVKSVSSLMRLCAVSWQREKYEKLAEMASTQRLNVMVNACPTPAVMLSSYGRLKFFNQAFLRFIRTNMPMADFSGIQSKLKLKFDRSIMELMDDLSNDEAQMIKVSFVISIDQKFFKGRMNCVMAPCETEQLVMGYITN